MKILKGLFTIIFLSVLIISCKDSKKEEQSESMDSIETVEGTQQINTEMNSEEDSTKKSENKGAAETDENAGFSYTVNYPKDTELAGKVDATIKSLLANHPELESDFDNAYGYAIFPEVTKAGLGVGGAGGKGLVFENSNVIGLTKLIQATLGLQAGGQQYTQAIFFENKEALDNFTNEKFKFSSEASAVALKAGASTNVKYHEGVATVIKSEKGAMFEATLGSQKFKFDGEM